MASYPVTFTDDEEAMIETYLRDASATQLMANTPAALPLMTIQQWVDGLVHMGMMSVRAHAGDPSYHLGVPPLVQTHATPQEEAP